jgi:hypothetical protein
MQGRPLLQRFGPAGRQTTRNVRRKPGNLFKSIYQAAKSGEARVVLRTRTVQQAQIREY